MLFPYGSKYLLRKSLGHNLSKLRQHLVQHVHHLHHLVNPITCAARGGDEEQIQQFAIEIDHRHSGFTYQKWWFPKVFHSYVNVGG